jgi:hypothetical protein
MVTSQKMIENEMDNRGSKSIVSLNTIKNTFVKEQRVDGSYSGFIFLISPELRCTLTDFERNYQISNPSNQLIIQTRSFYIHSNKPERIVLQPFMVKTKNFSTLSATLIKPTPMLNP